MSLDLESGQEHSQRRFRAGLRQHPSIPLLGFRWNKAGLGRSRLTTSRVDWLHRWTLSHNSKTCE